jgi:hypothetical protein
MASAKTESLGRLTLNNLVKPPSPPLVGEAPGLGDMDRTYLSSPLLT